MVILYYIVLVFYILYAILYLYLVTDVFWRKFPLQNSLPSEIKQKYYMFIRGEVDKVNACSVFACGLTLGFFRFYLYTLTMILTNWLNRAAWCCSDTNKPLSKCRRCLTSTLNRLSARFAIFTLGYWWIHVVKKKIKDYDPDYPNQPT